MKRTFTTTMPDRVGAFLQADRCLTRLNLNITRVSYNKAVDTHMLFLEVEGEPDALRKAEEELTKLGYLQSGQIPGRVMLIEFQLQDKPGALYPVLRLIASFQFNISYISSQENGSPYQYFKMGLFVENEEEISEFMQQAALLCPVRVLEYDKSERSLDNTVFYLNFASDISAKMGFSGEEMRQLIVHSNKIMQMLEERNSPPYKTFDYIARFADSIQKYKEDGFCPRITCHTGAAGMHITLIEPPCGSNLCLMDCGSQLLCVDSGFPCYREETLKVLRQCFPDFDSREKILILTHSDVDHSGLIGDFDRVYCSRACMEDFQREQNGRLSIREENPLHEPYVHISKLISGFIPPSTDHFIPIDSATAAEEVLTGPTCMTIGPLHFLVYEGKGGHVQSEIILINPENRIVFTGDIFVNIKGFTESQARFNGLAPYLMTSVDTDPALAKAEREAFRRLLTPGKWQIYGGHGAMYPLEIQP